MFLGDVMVGNGVKCCNGMNRIVMMSFGNMFWLLLFEIFDVILIRGSFVVVVESFGVM